MSDSIQNHLTHDKCVQIMHQGMLNFILIYQNEKNVYFNIKFSNVCSNIKRTEKYTIPSFTVTIEIIDISAQIQFTIAKYFIMLL